MTVQNHQFLRIRARQRVELQQQGVVAVKQESHLSNQHRQTQQQLSGKTPCGKPFDGLVGTNVSARRQQLSLDQVRTGPGRLFDIGAAVPGEEQEGFPGAIVVGDAQEVFRGEVDPFFQENAVHRFVPEALLQEALGKVSDGVDIVDRLDTAPEGPLSTQGLDFDDSGQEVFGRGSGRG